MCDMLNIPAYRRRGATAREWPDSTSKLRSPCHTTEEHASTAIRKPERCLWRYVPSHLLNSASQTHLQLKNDILPVANQLCRLLKINILRDRDQALA